MDGALSKSAGRAGRPVRILSERRLAERVAVGDQRAFEEVYRRYHQQIFRYCRSILRHEEDARDALQNTMAKALRALPGDGREIRLKAWLYRVAHNECIDILRASEISGALDGSERDPRASVESEVGDRQRLRQILDDIGELPERQKGVLVMRELSDLDFDEIAEATESTPAACRQTLYEARLALQAMQEGRSMRCDEVRSAISGGDRRVLRGRTLRAHLRDCDNCQAFHVGIESRQAELRSLVPFLPAAFAASILGSITGASGGIGGGLIGLFGGGSMAGGGVGAGLGAGAGVTAGISGKAVAVIAVAVGMSAGAAGIATQQRVEAPDGGVSPGSGAIAAGPGPARTLVGPVLTVPGADLRFAVESGQPGLRGGGRSRENGGGHTRSERRDGRGGDQGVNGHGVAITDRATTQSSGDTNSGDLHGAPPGKEEQHPGSQAPAAAGRPGSVTHGHTKRIRPIPAGAATKGRPPAPPSFEAPANAGRPADPGQRRGVRPEKRPESAPTGQVRGSLQRDGRSDARP